MASYWYTECQKLVSGSVATCATFAGGVQKIYISSDADVYIGFDENVPVSAGNALLLKGGNMPTEFDLKNGNIQKVWSIGSGNVYIMGVRSA